MPAWTNTENTVSIEPLDYDNQQKITLSWTQDGPYVVITNVLLRNDALPTIVDKLEELVWAYRRATGVRK